MGRVIEFVIYGRIPSKKNNKRWIMRADKRFLVPSKAHEDWENEQSWMIKKYKPKIPIDHCDMEITIYFPDKRAVDLTNKVESIMDLLVKNEFIVDDCWSVVPKIMLISKGIDKENPRAEIKIIPKNYG